MLYKENLFKFLTGMQELIPLDLHEQIIARLGVFKKILNENAPDRTGDIDVLFKSLTEDLFTLVPHNLQTRVHDIFNHFFQAFCKHEGERNRQMTKVMHVNNFYKGEELKRMGLALKLHPKVQKIIEKVLEIRGEMNEISLIDILKSGDLEQIKKMAIFINDLFDQIMSLEKDLVLFKAYLEEDYPPLETVQHMIPNVLIVCGSVKIRNIVKRYLPESMPWHLEYAEAQEKGNTIGIINAAANKVRTYHDPFALVYIDDDAILNNCISSLYESLVDNKGIVPHIFWVTQLGEDEIRSVLSRHSLINGLLYVPRANKSEGIDQLEDLPFFGSVLLPATTNKVCTGNFLGPKQYMGNDGLDIRTYPLMRNSDKTHFIEDIVQYMKGLRILNSGQLGQLETVVDELWTNALFGGAQDENGVAIYNDKDREHLDEVLEQHAGEAYWVYTGELLLVGFKDPFGTHKKDIVMKKVSQGVNVFSGNPNSESGGAGIGTAMSVNNVDSMVYIVEEDVQTEQIAILNFMKSKRKGVGPMQFQFFVVPKRKTRPNIPQELTDEYAPFMI